MGYFSLSSNLHPEVCYKFLSRFSCWAIAINLLTYVYTALWLNATTRKVFIIQSSCVNECFPHIIMSFMSNLWSHAFHWASNQRKKTTKTIKVIWTSHLFQFLNTCRYVFHTNFYHLELNMSCNVKTKFVFLFKDMKGMKVVMNGMSE
jgi:hypothetical protein